MFDNLFVYWFKSLVTVSISLVSVWNLVWKNWHNQQRDKMACAELTVIEPEFFTAKYFLSYCSNSL